MLIELSAIIESKSEEDFGLAFLAIQPMIVLIEGQKSNKEAVTKLRFLIYQFDLSN